MTHHIYDIAASLVLDEATARFSPNYRVSIELLDHFRAYCAVLDDVVSEPDCKGYNISVNENTHDITVTLYMKELNIASQSFAKIEEAATKANTDWTVVFRAENDDLCVNVVTSGIWEEA